MFLDDIEQYYENSDCNKGLSLYEQTFSNNDDFYEFRNQINFPIQNTEKFNEAVIDCIIDDDVNLFSNLINDLAISTCDTNINLSMTNYKLPKILADCPPISCMCAFFGAKNCLLFLCNFFQDGFLSSQMKKQDFKGRSIVHFACAGGNFEIVEMLEKAGFLFDANDFEGYQPIHYSVMNDKSHIFKYLYEKGANPFFIKTSNCLSPYHVACYFGNTEILKFLDDRNDTFSIFYHNNYNDISTPLCLACKGSQDIALKYLLTKINITDEQPKILYQPLLSAIENGSIYCVKTILHTEKIKLLDDDSLKNLMIKTISAEYSDVLMVLLKYNIFSERILSSIKGRLLEFTDANYNLQYLIENGFMRDDDDSNTNTYQKINAENNIQ